MADRLSFAPVPHVARRRKEIDSMGGNVLAIAEISLKDGPTCLTRPIARLPDG